jgi:hydroxymethylglutaryl-CoA lyase
MGDRVTIHEVGLRDGLQNEHAVLPTEEKLALAGGLLATGLRRLEITSFVSPKAIPQMADAAELMARVRRTWPDVHASALVVTELGYERALRAGAQAVASVVIASETLSQRNSRMGVEDSMRACSRIVGRARADGLWIRVYLSAAWGCPYEGPVAPERVLRLAEQIWALKPDELALADSTGRASCREIGSLLEAVGRQFGLGRLAVHLHEAGGRGLANAAAALSAGVRILDASIGGLGGCPFAKDFRGNLDTQALVELVHGMGFTTGVRPEALGPIAKQIETTLARRVGAKSGNPEEPLR